MAILVILILAGLWAAVLVPPILRSRSEAGGHGGFGHGGFGHGSHGHLSDLASRFGSLGRRNGHQGPPLGAIGPVQPIVGPLPGTSMRLPGAMSPAQKRRRDVLLVLTGLCALSFLMAVVARSTVFWALFLVSVLLVGGYVLMLLQMKQRAAERREKVRRLDQARPITLPQYGQLAEPSLVTIRRTGTR